MKKFLSIILTFALMLTVLPFGLFTIPTAAATIGYSTSYDALTGGRIIHSAQGDISGDFEIPSILFGDTVTGIAAGAFEDCSKITSITIPDTVISIGSEAFRWCENLKSVIIPDGVTSIGSYAFANCTSLANILLPNNGMEIGYRSFYDTAYYKNSSNWKNGVLYIGSHCIDSKDTISESYTVKNGTKSIGENALAYVTDLVNITLPDSVEVIATDAFRSSDNLQNITIGSGVLSIGSAFEHCKSLQNINVSFENEFFSSEEGVLFDKTKVKLLCYPNGKNEKSYIIPNTVNTIVSHAFYNNSYLSEITIPISVSVIKTDAFYFSFEKVYYRGSKSDANSIWMGYSINLSNATWYYNSCLGSSTHKYDNACDNECNVCFDLRTPPHNFKWVIDLKESCVLNGIKHEECSICHTKRNENTIIDGTNSHVYINACDDTCEVCKKSRSAPHYYEWVIDKKEKCNEIGIKHEECTTCHIKRNENTIIETKPHTYKNICDFDCNMCGFIREVPEHSYGTDLTCDICKYSKTPDIPILEVVLADIIKLQSVIGCEYSKDGINWQTSPEFLSLKPNTEYTFYQRVAESANSLVSEASAGLTITTKNRFIVSYDANGGYNAPATQLKGEGVPINISSQKPTRNGYVFVGWGTTEKCGKQYAPGEEYTKDEDITFYALWYDAKYCSNCDAKGEIEISSCYLCNGNGMRDACTKCGSTSVTEYITGYGSIGKRCNSCGTYPTSTTKSVRCSNCSGRGYIYEICEVCNGSCVEIIKQNAPTVVSFTDSVVILMFKEGCEYSKNGTDWQESNIFSDLLPATDYTFYIRQTSTETTPFSPSSLGVNIKTDKRKQTLIPIAPTVQSSTATSITLNAVDGCEYSNDGINWQTSNIFSGLLCGTEYTFYQRYKETETTYVSKSSEPFVVKTDKGIQSKPSSPTILSKTHNSVTLTALSGYEYSRDGINWQSSNVFSELTPETNYMFYQRKAETAIYYASEASAARTVKTDEEPTYTLGDIDGVEGITDADAEYMLMYTFFPEDYPVNQECDFNGDGKVNDADAEHLLMFTFFPEDYPLY